MATPCCGGGLPDILVVDQRAVNGDPPCRNRPRHRSRPAKKKRTIQEIRDSKHTGEKMVYMSVPEYTAARWAEMAGVDVAVVGDSLAMIAHGHPNTIPATMDMMVLHAQAIRRGAPEHVRAGAACPTRATTPWTAPS
jgi:hypothetical protein